MLEVVRFMRSCGAEEVHHVVSGDVTEDLTSGTRRVVDSCQGLQTTLHLEGQRERSLLVNKAALITEKTMLLDIDIPRLKLGLWLW